MVLKSFVLVMLLFFCRCGETAELRWRTPGISGSWDDPTNWIATEDGAARVPTKYDDVVLGHEFHLRDLGAYTITVHREGKPVEVNSLRMESQGYCAPQQYHVWNGSQYREISLEETKNKVIRTGVLLDVVAPTTLMVHHPGEPALSFGKNAFVRLSGSKRDPWAMPQLAFVGGGSLAVYEGGELTGNGHIVGNVKMYLHSTIRPLVWWKGLPYPDERLLGGTIHVSGRLSLNWVTLEMFVNGYERNMFAQIRVDGELHMQPSGDLSNDGRSTNRLIVSTGGQWEDLSSPSKSPSLVIYQSITGANGTGVIKNTIFNVTELPMQPVRLEEVVSCDNQPAEETVPAYPAQCQRGTSRHDLSFLLSSQSYQNECPEASCPGTPPCSGRGRCEDGYCVCDQGWADLDCTAEDCPGHPDCNGHGYCVVNDEGQPVCDCLPGWSGDACGKARCHNDCTDEEHGYCDSSSLVPQCVCYAGFNLGPEKDCSLPFQRCPGLDEECSGFGECNRTTGSCSCHANRIGSDCSIPSCPPTQCSHHGACTWDALLNTSRCQCDEGWSGEDCSSPSLDCSSPEACSGHGVCMLDLDPPRCLCNGPKDFLPSSVVTKEEVDEEEARGWTGEACEVLVMDCTSEESRCGSRCGNNETEGFGCMMNECPLGWKGWDCNTPVCLDTGNPECHGHGRCVAPQDKSSPPQCQCREGWLPPDCRFARCSVVGEGGEECSGRGTCKRDLSPPRCLCDPFAYGPLCEQYSPPCAGLPEECAGHGTCINGTCECEDDWRGLDCSIIDHEGECLNNCSSNGVCKQADSEGSNKLPVCHCFDGWAGADCSRESNLPSEEEEDFMEEHEWVVPLVVVVGVLLVVAGIACSVVLLRKREKKALQSTSALSSKYINYE